MTPDQIKNLAERLQPYTYVVQRNWHNLPESIEVNGHGDLDLYCTDEDVNEIRLIIRELPLVDVRSPMDNYYPEELGKKLLENRRMHGGFYIPNTEAYFNALYYHNAVHKQNDPYKEELRETFLSIYPPVRPDDPGVGYYL